MPSLSNNLYQFGEFSLDAQSRLLRRAGAAVAITPKAFDVLFFLVRSGDRIVTKDELMKAVWADSFVEESNLTQTIFMVRKALDETAERRYILTVQGQGYRFVVPVMEAGNNGAEVEAAAVAASDASSSSAGASSSGASKTIDVAETQAQASLQAARNWKPAAIGLAAVALLLVAASGLWFWRSQPGASRQPAKTMLAVLPFENFTGDPAQEYFSDGLTEEMISQLGDLDPGHLGVIARTSVMHYKHSSASIPEIGKDLSVQYVVEGSVR
jgi:DNA-binding winged helix-turn-helix (wHTH) protein